MPELPEVETVRRGLAPLLLGRRVLSVEVREARLRVPIRRRALGRICGARVTAVKRRSKYLLVETDAGLTLLMHLGMTGQLWIADRDRPRRPHEHLVFALDDGRQLRFADARRFGFVDLVPSRIIAKHPRLRDLGPEPLEGGFTAASCHAAARGRRKPIKNFLMDTRAVAGIGNIYACEALHRAALNPRRPVGRIGLPAWERLIAALRAVLNEALRAGGTTRRDFLNAEGEPGYFAVSLRVYDREGKPCGRCGRPIRRIVQAGRSTFTCPGCQR
ncbi:MAG TPA: bifunctional DNA-formamidopyrimidine glycosylase/DNA-(apurinic or apyrimidinic site) lyase [Candidatus Polarisedimenticolia bacterium]|jgi:formamidopyrimidine-DNA glycosylase|nr:bifunctional DNA-formamidopyrimidine glycosylase/DNA-(apurinic or apyrimidinic site) lyase [Candidatus Polarisedimenticolia bacterium]